MRFLAFVIILVGFHSSLCAGTNWYSEVHDGKAIICYKREADSDSTPGFAGLKHLLATLDPEVPISHVCFWDYFNHDPVVQSELFKVFQAEHPAELKAALASAGNMHNPKVLPLRKLFSAALVKTQTIQSIDKIFGEHGHMISGISFEKFWIDKREETPRIHAIVWLGIAPKTQVQERSATE